MYEDIHAALVAHRHMTPIAEQGERLVRERRRRATPRVPDENRSSW